MTIKADITQLGDQYLQNTSAELEELLLNEYLKVRSKDTPPVRGEARDFWLGVRDRLVAKIVKNRDAASATFGFVVSQVLNWAQSAGLDITAYRIPVAILSALVFQAVMEEVRKQAKKTS